MEDSKTNEGMIFVGGSEKNQVEAKWASVLGKSKNLEELDRTHKITKICICQLGNS